ncbi:hypothetical protein [Motilimonas pumila]|uniref:Uncharacterized protein n=1 Tax=Motilimonas pumila TaxID=2303987 RepID=A0A418YK58_9GAMM|nr:hypothetical protein [Motilimonas pumila]RJG51355.1 hypothetical protein D1Z90_01065 [Motilimonas pumila]
MTDANDNHFCVLASGECLPGKTTQNVRQKLLSQWQLSEQECDHWLEQKQVFFRQGLTEDEAKILQNTLENIGLQSERVSQREVDIEAPQGNQDGLLAQRYLSIATTLLLLTYIIDNTLLKAALPGIENLDFGFFPYLFSIALMCKGLYHFAHVKGYSGYLGLLGLTGLFGLAITLLLPHRELSSRRKIFQSSTIFAFCCLGFGAMSLHSLLGHYLYQDEYVAISRQLETGRNQFPSQQLDQQATIFNTEWQELQLFIDTGLDKISSEQMRPRYQAAMLEAIGEEVDHLFIWINYQEFLHQKVKVSQFPLPEKQINKWKQDVFDKLWAFRENFKPGEQVYTSLSKYLGQGGVRYEDVEAASSVGQYLGNTYKAMQQASLNYLVKHQQSEQPEPIWPLDLKEVASHQQRADGLNIEVHQDSLTFTFTKGPLAGFAPLHIAVIHQYRPATKWQRAYSSYQFRQISSGFPNHLLHSFGVRTLDKQINLKLEERRYRR